MTDKNNLSSIRRDFTSVRLDKSSVNKNPFIQFKTWFDEVLQSDVLDPNALFLATADADGRPSARTVLLKEVNEKGFVFFTNYNSKKGKDLQDNPYASLLFYWDYNSRQIRIDGRAEKVSAEESDKYFYTRPRDSQIGAIASNQSEIIPDRSVLELKVAEISKSEKIQRPDHWGGYLVIPSKFEFWQGQTSRLHDRLVYELDQNKEWKIARLSP